MEFFIEHNFANRNYLLVLTPLTDNYKKMVAEVESKYPGFKILESDFNPTRFRWINNNDFYEFYLEREKKLTTSL